MQYIKSKKWLLWFVAIFTFLVINAIVSTYNTNNLLHSQQLVVHSQEVKIQLGVILGTLLDAETGERGYVLTHKKEFLEPYERAELELKNEILKLRNMTVYNAIKPKEIDFLEEKINLRNQYLVEGISLSEKNKPVYLYHIEQGKAYMDEIRKIIQSLNSKEDVLLKRRENVSFLMEKNSRNSLSIATIIALLLLMTSYFIFEKYNKEKKNFSEQLLMHNSNLKESEERNRLVIHNALDAVVESDINGIVVSWNLQATIMFGWLENEAIGKPLCDLIIPEKHRDSHIEGFKRYIKTEESSILNRRIEIEASKKNGEEFFVELAVTCILTSKGKIFNAFISDISDRKKNEKDLIQRAKQQKILVEMGMDAFNSKDLSSWLQSVSEKVALTLDVEMTKICELIPEKNMLFLKSGTGWHDGLVGKYFLSISESQSGFTLQTEKPVIVEDLRCDERFTSPTFLKDHNVISGISVIIYSGYGEKWGVMGAHTTKKRKFNDDDVSFFQSVANLVALVLERNKNEEEILKSEERHRSLMEALPQMVISYDSKGVCDYVNKQWIDYVGLTAEENTRQKINDYSHPEDHEKNKQGWIEAAKLAIPWEQSGRIKGIDGVYRWFLVRAVPIKNNENSIVKWIITFTNIENQKQDQQKILALNQKLRRAMTETHHRVKNNLQLIAALVDMRLMEKQDAIPASEFHRIGMQVNALAAVHEILTSESKSDENTEYISSEKIVIKLINILQGASQHHKIDYDVEDMKLSARQSTSLALIVNELVSNAMKHGNGNVHISLLEQDNHIVLEVTDNGKGFSEDFDYKKEANTGLELVESLTKWDLGGIITFDNQDGGGRVTLVAPLEPIGVPI